MRPSKWLPLKETRAPAHQAKMLSHIRSLGLTGHDQAVLSHKDKRLLMDKNVSRTEGQKDPNTTCHPAPIPWLPHSLSAIHSAGNVYGWKTHSSVLNFETGLRVRKWLSQTEQQHWSPDIQSTALDPDPSIQHHHWLLPVRQGLALWAQVGLNLPLPASTSQVLVLQACPAMPNMGALFSI